MVLRRCLYWYISESGRAGLCFGRGELAASGPAEVPGCLEPEAGELGVRPARGAAAPGAGEAPGGAAAPAGGASTAALPACPSVN